MKDETKSCMDKNFETDRTDLRIKFYHCKKCGKIIVIVNETPVPTVCCGEKMSELVPLTCDDYMEKHVPVIHHDNNIVTVTVGNIEHPMKLEHHIQWVILLTDKGIQKKFLFPGDEPKANFALTDGESIIGAYAFCNVHKLWKDS